jgi:hypothetical protein
MGVVELDLMLLFLVLSAFVMLSYLGIPVWWSLLATIFFALVYLGLRYPRGKPDWRYSFKETSYIVMTLMTMFVFIIAIQAALLTLGSNIPPAVELLVFFIVMPVMVILFILGLFFPHGKAFRLDGKSGLGEKDS